jgi:hypothetical protein
VTTELLVVAGRGSVVVSAGLLVAAELLSAYIPLTSDAVRLLKEVSQDVSWGEKVFRCRRVLQKRESFRSTYILYQPRRSSARKHEIARTDTLWTISVDKHKSFSFRSVTSKRLMHFNARLAIPALEIVCANMQLSGTPSWEGVTLSRLAISSLSHMAAAASASVEGAL